MSLSIDIAWNWTAFGFLIGYHKDKFTHVKSIMIHVGFLSISFDWWE